MFFEEAIGVLTFRKEYDTIKEIELFGINVVLTINRYLGSGLGKRNGGKLDEIQNPW